MEVFIPERTGGKNERNVEQGWEGKGSGESVRVVTRATQRYSSSFFLPLFPSFFFLTAPTPSTQVPWTQSHVSIHGVCLQRSCVCV